MLILSFFKWIIALLVALFLFYIISANSMDVVIHVLPNLGVMQGYSYQMPLSLLIAIAFFAGVLVSFLFVLFWWLKKKLSHSSTSKGN